MSYNVIFSLAKLIHVAFKSAIMLGGANFAIFGEKEPCIYLKVTINCGYYY